MMKKQLMIWTLIFGMGISSLQGNEKKEEESGSAYTESSNAVYWTPYLPIAILVVAAIYLGTSDKGERHSSIGYSSHGGSYRKDCYDGLGPIAGRLPSQSQSSYTYTRCKVCISH